MICGHIELTIETTTPKDLAKAMLRFWQYQAEQARQYHAACKHRLEAGLMANERAKEEYRKNDDFGFGPALPFSDAEIARCKGLIPGMEKNLEEANSMAGYMINYITERAHPEQ